MLWFTRLGWSGCKMIWSHLNTFDLFFVNIWGPIFLISVVPFPSCIPVPLAFSTQAAEREEACPAPGASVAGAQAAAEARGGSFWIRANMGLPFCRISAGEHTWMNKNIEELIWIDMDSFFHFWYFHLGQNMIRTYPTLPCGTPLFWISMVPFPSCIPVLWCSWPGCWARRSASCSWGFWSWSWGTAGSRRGKRRFLVGSGPTWAYHFVEALHGIIHGWTKTLKDHEGSSWIFKIMFSWCFFLKVLFDLLISSRSCVVCSYLI